MAGIRQFLAGAAVFVWIRARGPVTISRVHWRSAFVIGVVLLGVGNGGLSWAEQRVPSGIASLIIASIPAWFVIMQLVQRTAKPTRQTIGGLALGSIGTLILVDPARLSGTGGVDLVGAVVLLLAAMGWAFGSLYSRTAEQASPIMLATGLQMMAGGAVLIGFGIATGELASFSLAGISLKSLLALGYLICFGSLVGYSSYIWLLKVSKPSNVATYAYVNPVIAVILGWLVAGEPMNARVVLATVVTVGAVALITGSSIRRFARAGRA